MGSIEPPSCHNAAPLRRSIFPFRPTCPFHLAPLPGVERDKMAPFAATHAASGRLPATSVNSLIRALRGALPYALHKYLYTTLPERQRLAREQAATRARIAVAASNARFKDVHKGRRCFILCNGPSVKKQDLAPLESELVISVSSGYQHPLYKQIAPRYHVVPQLTYGRVTREDAIKWFREMHAALGDAVLFLSSSERELVESEGLFRGREVHYVVLWDRFADHPAGAIPDVARDLPAVQSVPVLCLMIALYMGCAPIYLLGTDHDHFRTGEYKYFFEPTVLRDKDITADAQGKLRGGWANELAGLAALWQQYLDLDVIARANGVQIFNATAGGELDVFPRAELDSLFPAPSTC